MSWIDERDVRLQAHISISKLIDAFDEKWYGCPQNKHGPPVDDISRISTDGFGPMERMPLLNHGRGHQRHVSIDNGPSGSIGSFQFHQVLADESSLPGSSPSAPPGFTPIIPWVVASSQPSQPSLQPAVMAIKDAGTTPHQHEVVSHGSLQPLTLHSLLASTPSTPLGTSPIILNPAASAPLDVGGSQKRGTLFSSLLKEQAAANNVSSSSRDKLMEQRSGLDSLEQAFLTSKDTPPHEQLLGPTDGGKIAARGGTDLHSILSNLPRHLKVNIPQQQQPPSTISILQAAGHQQRSSQSQTVYNDMVTVATTQPIAAQRKAGSSAAQVAMRDSYKAIQEMKINKVKMPPLTNQASALSRRTSTESEVSYQAIATQPGDRDSEKSSSSNRVSSEPPVGSLSHTFSRVGTEPSAAWIGEMIPAASIGDCPLEVGSFRVFLLRIDEAFSSKASEGSSSLTPRTWTGLRSKLVLRACLKEDVEGISRRLLSELNSTAASHGLDQESCQRITVVPLGQGVVEPSGGQGKRVFLSVSEENEEEGKTSMTKVDIKASQAVDVPLVMETLLR